jgi:protein arginine kinase activator
MDCERCKSSKATVFFTQIVHGQMQKVDLCEACAKEVGATSTNGFSLSEVMMAIKAAPKVREPAESFAVICPNCGMSEADFKKSGRLGCGQCYTTFQTILHEALRDMHKAMTHHGKVPQRYAEALQQGNRLAALRTELERAVADEQFEQAASLRDQIRILERVPDQA